MKRIVSIIDALSEITGNFLACSVFILMCLVLIEVTTRYILRSPWAVMDEYGGYALVGITFLGLGYTWKYGGHVRVDFVINWLPGKVQNWLRLITLVIAFVLTCTLITASFEFVSYTKHAGLRSGTWLRTPLFWPQAVLPIGAVLLFAQLIAEIIKAIENLKTPKKEQ